MGIKFLSSAVMTVLATPLDEAAGTVLTACRAKVGLIEVEATFGSLSHECQLRLQNCLQTVFERRRVSAPDPKKSWGTQSCTRR